MEVGGPQRLMEPHQEAGRHQYDAMISDAEAVLGREERLKLDAHLESIRQLETSLMVDTSGCGAPTVPMMLDSRANDNFPAVVRAQLARCYVAFGADARLR